jgi:GTPase
LAEMELSDLSVRRDRAMLVKVITNRFDQPTGDPLEELAALAKAAGAIVVGTMIQKTRKPAAGTHLGRGKVIELKARMEDEDADLAIFDNDLAPSQIRELGRRLECRVLDRSELILDIFAERARTHESRLQVELAQLQYTAPRLRGMWTHLERIAGAGGGTGAGNVGGIGTRGPGERQIEIDRRIVRDRISALKREIAAIDRRKIRQVKSRGDCFTVSLVGYTNSGKSTLLNALTGTKQYAADKLFATLDTKTVRWDLGDGMQALLSDTVGFVRDLPHRLVASFRATLEEAVHADLLLHVVDASNPNAMRQVLAVESVLEELECKDVPTLSVLNKIDAVEDEVNLQILESKLPGYCAISAKIGTGIDELINRVREAAASKSRKVVVRAPVGEGRLVAELSRLGNVLSREYTDESVELEVVIDGGELNRLVSLYPSMTVVSTDESTSVVD